MPLADTIAAALAFDSESAAKLIAERIDPIHRKVIFEINKLVELQQAAVDAKMAAAGVASRQLSMMLFALGLGALILGAALAWMFSRSITHPLREALRVARAVAAGDLSS